MTCIVGYIDKENKRILVGGDCAGVGGSYLTHRKDPKVFIRDSFIIGFTTSFRMGQLLMSDDRLQIRRQKEEEINFDYMISAFIPAIQKLFEDGGFLKTDKGEKEGGTFIVGYKGDLFEVQSDFQVAQYINDFCACGCGMDYALGSLFATKNDKIEINVKINNALLAAEHFSTSVSSPFKIIELKY